MQHTPTPELDAETIDAAAARVAAMNLSADKPSNEELAEKYIVESGKTVHASDCSTSIAPAEVPGPCDCDVQSAPAAHSVKPTKPERKAITVDLTDCPEVYARIKQLAEADDRTTAMWLKRYLRKESGATVAK